MINPEHQRFGGIGWRVDMKFATRKEAKAHIASRYGINPNKYAVKIEAEYPS
jgi:hypothetical protein